MVYKYCRNMIGETEAGEEKASINGISNDSHEEVFLSELGRHVHKSGNMPSSQHKSDNLARISGFGIGVGSLYLQEALGYPFVVLRRQCQVNHGGLKYHIQPFSLFKVVGKIHHRQGIGVFWKGWGSNCIVKGVSIVTEIITCELLSIPRRDISKGVATKEQGSTKEGFLNEALKGLTVLLTLPLHSACLTDSVQSLALDKTRHVFTFFRDAFERVIGWYVSRGHGRLLPFSKLILPSIAYGVVNYATKYLVGRIVIHYNYKRYSINDKLDESNMKKIYYTQLMTTLLSTFITEVITYPMETVMLRLHLQGTRTIIDDTDKGIGVVPLCTNYDDMRDCVESILRVEGVGGLYKGFGALLVQYFVQFLIVKMSKPLYCN